MSEIIVDLQYLKDQLYHEEHEGHEVLKGKDLLSWEKRLFLLEIPYIHFLLVNP